MRHDDARSGQPPRLSQKIGGPEPIGRNVAAHRQVAPRSKPRENKSRRAGHQLVAMRQPPAGSVAEPAHHEMAGDSPRDLTSRLTTSEPDERSWDFDGCKLTSARNRTHRSPMLTHETWQVSGASVVGMTIWVGQGQSHLLADVPRITTALGQRGRLQPKSQLRQQPAGDFIRRGLSRRRQRNSSNGSFAKSGVAPTRSTEAGDRRDAGHARPPPTNGQDPPPRKDPRPRRRHMLSRCRSRGQRHFIKLPAPRQRARG
jgi:hypothetical protein